MNSSKSTKTEKVTTYYVVQYNDMYGDGTQKKNEVLVRTKKEFRQWLKKHNEYRDAEPEKAVEFDLIPINVFVG